MPAGKAVSGPRRRVWAALLLFAVTPGLWLQSPPSEGEKTGNLSVEALPVGPSPEGASLRVAGAWVLSSDDRRFLGYSALVVQADGRLRAYSDASRWLEFDPPDRAAVRRPRFGLVPGFDNAGHNDLEAAAHDPASGLTWLAFEHINSVRRVGPGSEDATSVAPTSMAAFSDNGGAEALARVPNGRFVLIAERAGWRYPLQRSALLFARDPVADPSATPFVFVPPPGSSPTDAAGLPDGRVLLLTRGLAAGRWPPFRSKLLVADSADIRAGEAWEWQELADLSGLVPPENYEGLAVEAGRDGFVLWLISDANRSVLLQRTVLVKLVWDGQTPG